MERKRGDTSAYSFTLTDDAGSPIADFANGDTARLLVKRVGDVGVWTETEVNTSAEVSASDNRVAGKLTAAPSIDTAATFNTAAATITYNPSAVEVGTAGDYAVEVEVTRTASDGGRVETFPTDGYLPERIYQDLG